jgi:hypothetical protein
MIIKSDFCFARMKPNVYKETTIPSRHRRFFFGKGLYPFLGDKFSEKPCLGDWARLFGLSNLPRLARWCGTNRCTKRY